LLDADGIWHPVIRAPSASRRFAGFLEKAVRNKQTKAWTPFPITCLLAQLG
jgi:hypothetical protein